MVHHQLSNTTTTARWLIVLVATNVLGCILTKTATTRVWSYARVGRRLQTYCSQNCVCPTPSPIEATPAPVEPTPAPATPAPTAKPTDAPVTPSPTQPPTLPPTTLPPTDAPVTPSPTLPPTLSPTDPPTLPPTTLPTLPPSDAPVTPSPTLPPTLSPTLSPTDPPTLPPTTPPTLPPTDAPVTPPPTPRPTLPPTDPPTLPPTIPPTLSPTLPPTPPPTLPPTMAPTNPPIPQPTMPPVGEAVEAVLEGSKNGIDNNLFLYETPGGQWEPSSLYRYSGFLQGLRVMYQQGINGKMFYMGDDSVNGHEYGLVNIASFVAQCMHESIKYDSCDENSFDLVNGRYPLSNACGQLGLSYQHNRCTPEEAHMEFECPVDPSMSTTATTNAAWYGAPGPLKCGPRSEYPVSGFWDHTAQCNKPWANPPSYCDAYDGQIAGAENNNVAIFNRNGRNNIEACCWWGRGVIQTTGVCNIGKLNYFLGKRAFDEGRESPYPTIDFCQDPGAICASKQFTELKWIAGMFYWVETVQPYERSGWNYMTELHKFVDGGMADESFVTAVSGIVNRGCHNPPCDGVPVDGDADRRDNFHSVLKEFGLRQ